MSAPKTPEGIARAKAKAEEKKRPRTPQDLVKEAWDVGMHFRCSAPDDRPDIFAAGELIQTAGKIIAHRGPLNEAQLAQVRRAELALRSAVGWGTAYRSKYVAISVDDKGLRELEAAIAAQDEESRKEYLRRRHAELHERFPGAQFAECTEECPKPPPNVVNFAAKREELRARRRGERRGEP